MNTFNKVKELIKSLESDADKFYNKDNYAAGTRLRKGMQDLKVLNSKVRKEIQEAKNLK